MIVWENVDTSSYLKCQNRQAIAKLRYVCTFSLSFSYIYIFEMIHRLQDRIYTKSKATDIPHPSETAENEWFKALAKWVVKLTLNWKYRWVN